MNDELTLSHFRELFPPSDSAAAPLQVGNLTVRFGGLVALNDVNFTMDRAETMSIVGQNGAGKSTLLNAISGLVPATPESRIELDGRSLSGEPAWRRGGAGLGRGFQDPPFIEDLSVRDNLLVGAHRLFTGSMLARILRPARFRAEEDRLRERADLLLDLVGLAERAEEPTGELPYGLRKLVDIVRSLMGGPGVLLLDEPSSGLDQSEQQVMTRLLELIRRSGTITVLMVEHHMSIVRAVSDRVLVLEAGRVAVVASPEDALDMTPAEEPTVPEMKEIP